MAPARPLSERQMARSRSHRACGRMKRRIDWRVQVAGHEVLKSAHIGHDPLTLIKVLIGRRLESPEWIHSARQALLRPAELNHARLQVCQWTFDKARLLLIVREEVEP